MHIIDTGKEHVTFVQTSEETAFLSLDTCEIIFRQEVILEGNNQKAELVIVKKDNAGILIAERVNASVRPADRAFIHTVDCNFVQAQEILVGMIYNKEAKEVEFFTCKVIDIVPNGYL